MTEAQTRAAAEVERARAEHPDGRVVLVSHSDVIKAVLAGVLGLSLDAYSRSRFRRRRSARLPSGTGEGRCSA
jgi:broad specificity phosphatase PhoE